MKAKPLILFFFIIASSLPAQTPQFKISNKFPLEGDSFWDFITSDDAKGRLFVSHGTMLQVIDENTGKLLGTIPGTIGIHGAVLAPELNKGFTSNGRDTSVTVFNYTDLKPITTVKVTGINPDAIVYDPFSKRVFTFNGGSSDATVIDANTNEVVGTIPLDGKPEVGVSDGNGKIYLNIEDKSLICVINTSTLEVEQRWSIAPGEEPSGLALDNENHILFSVCSNKLMVIVNAESGAVITTVPIGSRVDGAAFDNVKKYAYSSNGEGTLTVVKEEGNNKFTVVDNFNTQLGARTITVNSITHHIYLPTAEFEPAPEPTTENPHPRPKIKPGTFVILDVEPLK